MTTTTTISSPSEQETRDCVTELRKRMLASAAEHPEEYDQLDIQRIATDEWSVRRYLQVTENNDVDEALCKMQHGLRIRRMYDVNHILATDFPQEFYDTSEAHLYDPCPGASGEDGQEESEQLLLLIVRTKFHHPAKVFDRLTKQYLLHLLEEAERISRSSRSPDDGGGGESDEPRRRFVIIFDMTDCSLSNVDLPTMRFFFVDLPLIYPDGMSFALAYQMPWIIQAIAKMVLAWLPARLRRKIRFVNSRELFEHVPREHLPDYLGGTCTLPYRPQVDGALTLEQLAERGPYEVKEMREMVKYLEKVLGRKVNYSPGECGPGKVKGQKRMDVNDNQVL